jgi:Holliday junction resolvase RusA-like endonuclease
VRWEFTIEGPPSQKKNSPQIGWVRGKPRIFPDPKYRKWAKSAIQQLRLQWGARTPLGDKTTGVEVEAIFYLGKGQHFDLSNLFEALGDVMEDAGIVKSDFYIDGWSGSRRDRDRERPRVDFAVTLIAARR